MEGAEEASACLRTISTRCQIQSTPDHDDVNRCKDTIFSLSLQTFREKTLSLHPIIY